MLTALNGLEVLIILKTTLPNSQPPSTRWQKVNRVYETAHNARQSSILLRKRRWSLGFGRLLITVRY